MILYFDKNIVKTKPDTFFKKSSELSLLNYMKSKLFRLANKFLFICLFIESDTRPVVIFSCFGFDKTIFFSLCNEQWHIFCIEST